MKDFLNLGILVILLTVGCKKENENTLQEDDFFCGVTGITGPVKYYLNPDVTSMFNFYKLSNLLIFVDSTLNDTTQISYSSESQIWDETTVQSQVQGDTVDVGEIAGISYNYGSIYISVLDYTFRAFPNGVDSMNILICGGNSLQQYPTHVSNWTLNLVDTNTFNTAGKTPFVVLDSITFLSHTFYDVYLLQNGNFLYPADSSNNCYYTKAHGVIAFTDKQFGKFWVRTNY